MITDSNRPICNKCKEEPALTYFNDLWLCSNCFVDFIKKQKKIKQQMILEG